MKVTRRMIPVSEVESRRRGDDLVAWSRDYLERRFNPRLTDERRSIPPHVVLDFGRAGLFGINVEEKYGGRALRHRDLSRVLEQLAAIDLGLGTWVLTSLFPGVRPIAAFGGPSLKDAFLSDLAAGGRLGGYAQTEPGAGTHFAAMAANAVARSDGSRRVSGSKVWIGNASWASVLTVMAHDVGANGRKRGLTALVVEVDRPGVELGPEMLSMGMRGMVQGEIAFRDVDVPQDRILGRPGRALEIGVDSMSYSRFAIAATCLGTLRRCVRLMHRFAGRRTIATGSLLAHPLTRSRLTEAVMRTEALETLLYAVADALDADEPVAAELFAVCKVAGSEFAWSTVDDLVQLLGSRGYDEATGVPQLLRDVRVTRIFEGASEPLLAFLGAAAPTERSDLNDALRDVFRRDDIARDLQETALVLRDRTADAADPVATRAWQAISGGEAALWATLLAAQPADRNSLTREWLEERFAETRSRCRNGDARERFRLDPGSLDEHVRRIGERVGDVTPSLPGERLGADPLLLR